MAYVWKFHCHKCGFYAEAATKQELKTIRFHHGVDRCNLRPCPHPENKKVILMARHQLALDYLKELADYPEPAPDAEEKIDALISQMEGSKK